MSEVYNPEAELLERLEALELSARQIREHRDAASDRDERRVLDQQLAETHERIASLKRRVREARVRG